MTAEDFKREHPLERILTDAGVKLVGLSRKKATHVCPIVTHKAGHLCVAVDLDKQLWHCNDCKEGGDVIRWLAKASGKSDGEILKANGATKFTPAPETNTGTAPELKFETVATYDYLDGSGELVYQVVRQHAADPSRKSGYAKTFRQRRPDASGGWIYSMEGVTRVLYNLPKVLTAKTVWIVEGEKDAENLAKLGFVATCNVGGAGKWMDGYTEAVAKRHVAICGDTDEAGKKHVEMVFASVVGKAKSVRTIRLPAGSKDVSDFIATFKTPEEAKRALFGLYDAAANFVKGVNLPIFKVSELEEMYQRHVAEPL